MFVELPPEDVYPDYYVVIEQPVSLSEIRGKVDADEYADTASFVADFELMTKNAQQYNGKHSPIAKEASKLLAFAKKRVDEYEKTAATAAKAEEDAGESSEDVFRAAAHGLVDDLVNYRKGGRQLSEIFMVEPDRKVYPDYYKIVKKATSLETVRRLIDEGSISTVEQLEDEMRRIFSNAQLFNEEGSQVYVDSVALERHFNKVIDKLKKSLAAGPGQGLRLKVRVKGSDKQEAGHKLKLSLRPADDDAAVKHEDEPADAAASPAASDVATKHEDGSTAAGDGETPAAEELKEEIIDEVRTREPGKTAVDALIRLVNVTSIAPASNRYTQPKNPLPPPTATDIFQVAVPASDSRTVQAHSFSVPSYHSTINLSVLLHESLNSRQHTLTVTHNQRRLMPVSSSANNPWADSSKPLRDRFEVRLAQGLNHIEVTAAASDEPSIAGQSARQASPAPPQPGAETPTEPVLPEPVESERFTLWVMLSR